MRHYLRDGRVVKPWRSQVVLGVLALVVLVVGTFFFVQALGGVEKVIALLGQGQAFRGGDGTIRVLVDGSGYKSTELECPRGWSEKIEPFTKEETE